MDSEVDQIPTYLNLTITTEPFIELPAENSYDYYPGGEPTNLLLHGTQWVKSMRHKNARMSTRVIKVFGENLQGQSVFLCRYLRPQKLPDRLAHDFGAQSDDQDTIYAIQNAA